MTWHKCPGGGGQVQDQMDLTPRQRANKRQREEQRGDRIDGAFFSVGVVAPSTLENVLSIWVYTV